MRLWALLTTVALLLASCGSATTNSGTEAIPGIRVVSPSDAAQVQNDPPAGLVILDVRTAEEFASGHLEGAIMIDFYGADFRDQIGALDPDVPYLLYCRSGNRSGQTRDLMAEFGFSDVTDIDGGIASWVDAGLPIVN